MGRLRQFVTKVPHIKKPALKKSLLVMGVFLTLAASLVIYDRVSSIDGPTPDQLREYLKSNSLEVGSAVLNDYQQVYLVYDNVQSFITRDEANHVDAVASGQYIAWVSTAYGDNHSLVYLYDALNRTTKQITFHGSAANPAIDGDRLVWQDDSVDGGAVFYYDGQSVRRLGENHISIRPAISGQTVAFAQYLGANDFQVVTYDTSTNESKIIKKGGSNDAWPRFENGKLLTSGP